MKSLPIFFLLIVVFLAVALEAQTSKKPKAATTTSKKPTKTVRTTSSVKPATSKTTGRPTTTTKSKTSTTKPVTSNKTVKPSRSTTTRKTPGKPAKMTTKAKPTTTKATTSRKTTARSTPSSKTSSRTTSVKTTFSPRTTTAKKTTVSTAKPTTRTTTKTTTARTTPVISSTTSTKSSGTLSSSSTSKDSTTTTTTTSTTLVPTTTARTTATPTTATPTTGTPTTATPTTSTGQTDTTSTLSAATTSSVTTTVTAPSSTLWTTPQTSTTIPSPVLFDCSVSDPACGNMCGDVTSTTTGVVQSSNFPGDYGNESRICKVTITAPAGWMIQLKFTTLNLETDVCNVDVADDITSLLPPTTGNTIPSLTPATIGSVDIGFECTASNKPNTTRFNWQATFSVTSEGNYCSVNDPACGNMCGDVTSAVSGVVQSPNFPDDYGNYSRQCVVTIIVPAGKKIGLAFTTFNLNTNFGSIDVGDSNTLYLSGVTGSTIPAVVTTSSNIMYIFFTTYESSEPNTSTYNWQATYTAVTEITTVQQLLQRGKKQQQ